VAEHDGKNLNDNTLALVTAASKIGGSISLLVAGSGASAVATQAAAVNGVSKVISVDNKVLI
jgi:electron transfer flavoprotein alpha subunit